jgi:FAD/FMN-containing dehydrogenase
MPYPELQSAFDALYPPGLHWYWKGDFVRELSDEAIAEHVRFAEVPTPLSIMHLYPIDGAVHRVAADATAWRHRDAVWSMVIAGVASNPSAHEKEAIMRWPKDYWEAVHPHCVNAAYINFMMEEGRDRIRASYGDNYERLAATKRRYDPRNLFRVNQNIEPAS